MQTCSHACSMSANAALTCVLKPCAQEWHGVTSHESYEDTMMLHALLYVFDAFVSRGMLQEYRWSLDEGLEPDGAGEGAVVAEGGEREGPRRRDEGRKSLPVRTRETHTGGFRPLTCGLPWLLFSSGGRRSRVRRLEDKGAL